MSMRRRGVCGWATGGRIFSSGWIVSCAGWVEV